MLLLVVHDGARVYTNSAYQSAAMLLLTMNAYTLRLHAVHSCSQLANCRTAASNRTGYSCQGNAASKLAIHHLAAAPAGSYTMQTKTSVLHNDAIITTRQSMQKGRHGTTVQPAASPQKKS
jgi:hypothetical protein